MMSSTSDFVGAFATSAKTALTLEMSHVGLGVLDEFGLMVLFGNSHSRFLTEGLSHNASQILDSNDRVLYPAYFMTHLCVPPALALGSFALWDSICIETQVRRYGDTILDSWYAAKSEKRQSDASITMRANSLFILDPAVFRTPYKQVSAPRVGALRDMERLNSPPPAIQESAHVRARGFEGAAKLPLAARPFRYVLQSNRDVAPGHPLIFAKIPLLMELSERQFLRDAARSRISEEMLQAVTLLERKTFYYGNAFAGRRLTLYTRGAIEPCRESLWKENPRMQYVCRIVCDTELYDDGELLALSRAEKAVVHEIRHQAMIQDTKRVFDLAGVEPNGDL